MNEEIKFDFIKEKSNKRIKDKKTLNKKFLEQSKLDCEKFVGKNKFVTTLIQVLDDKGISKSIVADSINIAPKTLYYWLDEKAENLPNHIETAFKINRFLESNVEYYTPNIFFADNNCYNGNYLDLQKFKIQYENQRQSERKENARLKNFDDFFTSNNLTISSAESKLTELKQLKDLLSKINQIIGFKSLQLLQDTKILQSIRNLHKKIKSNDNVEIEEAKQQLANVFETFIKNLYSSQKD